LVKKFAQIRIKLWRKVFWSRSFLATSLDLLVKKPLAP